jgi:hypothetical protein
VKVAFPDLITIMVSVLNRIRIANESFFQTESVFSVISATIGNVRAHV